METQRPKILYFSQKWTLSATQPPSQTIQWFTQNSLTATGDWGGLVSVTALIITRPHVVYWLCQVPRNSLILIAHEQRGSLHGLSISYGVLGLKSVEGPCSIGWIIKPLEQVMKALKRVLSLEVSHPKKKPPALQLQLWHHLKTFLMVKYYSIRPTYRSQVWAY